MPVYAFADELDLWLKGRATGVPATVPAAADPTDKLPQAPSLDFGQGDTGRPGPRSRSVSHAPMPGIGPTPFKPADTGQAAGFGDGMPEEAHALYLEAYYLWQKRTPDALAQAQRLLARVLDIAPGFAPAQADLATVYNLSVEYGVIRPEVGYELSRKAAERTLAIDPRNAQAHSIIGDISFFWDRDYRTGLDHFRRAAEINPQDVTSRHWYASGLMASGRFDEAAEQIVAARDLEPLSRSIIVSHAMILLGQGNPGQARDMLLLLVGNEPDYKSPFRFLAFCELALHNYQGYLNALLRRFRMTNDPAAERIAAAGEIAWRSGGSTELKDTLLAAAREHAEDVKDPYFVAHFLALGGDWTSAAHQLARTPTRRFAYYGIDPAFDAARDDPAFRGVIEEEGLPAIW